MPNINYHKIAFVIEAGPVCVERAVEKIENEFEYAYGIWNVETKPLTDEETKKLMGWDDSNL